MTVASALSLGTGRIVAAEQEILFTPRNGARGRRPVVVLPGQLQTATAYNQDTLPGQQSILRALVGAGLVGAVIDAAVAPQGWGSDLTLADIDLARVYCGTAFGCATDKVVLVGASAGALDAMNYTRAYPARVAAVLGIMPASDMDDLRDNNRAGTCRANINTAWGMPVGSTSATDPLPARANPLDDANAALIRGSGATIKLYYSTADTVAIPSTVVALAAKLGIVPTVISTTVDHSDALFLTVPLADLTQTANAALH